MADVKRTKVLCHGDGALFCNYHRDHDCTKYTHVIYLTDADVPPDPSTLDIDPSGATDVSSLRWFCIEAYITPIPTREQVLGAYDYDGSGFVGAV
jgi:hypothetical protein